MRRDVARETARAFVTSFLVTLAVLLAVLALAGCSLDDGDGSSTTETAAGRFSMYGAGNPYLILVVDHETGCQYLARYKYGMVQLTDADGSPLLVAEAGE